MILSIQETIDEISYFTRSLPEIKFSLSPLFCSSKLAETGEYCCNIAV